MAVLRVRAYLEAPVALGDPLHLDGLATACHPDVRAGWGRLTRSSDPEEIVRPRLPIVRIAHAGHVVYACSAAEVAPDARRDREHLTRRRDGDDLDYLTERVHTRSGPGRDVMMPYPVWLTPYVEWWYVGSRRGLKKLIQHRITHVGMMRRHGMGAVARWEIEATDSDPASVLLHRGRARRNLPAEWCDEPEVVEEVPVGAPYWHPSVHTAGVMAGRVTGLAPGLEAKVEALC